MDTGGGGEGLGNHHSCRAVVLPRLIRTVRDHHEALRPLPELPRGLRERREGVHVPLRARGLRFSTPIAVRSAYQPKAGGRAAEETE